MFQPRVRKDTFSLSALPSGFGENLWASDIGQECVNARNVELYVAVHSFPLCSKKVVETEEDTVDTAISVHSPVPGLVSDLFHF